MTKNDNNKLPVMSQKFLIEFVASYAEKKHSYINAAQQHGSPLYILEPEVLIKRSKQFKEAFKNRIAKVNCYFAMKSNNLPFISKVLSENGFGIDVSSGLELQTALSIGSENIVFSGPGKTNDELEMAVENSSRVTILIDSMGEFKRLKNILKTKNKDLEIGVRLNSNPEGLWRKFGIALDELRKLYQETKTSPLIKLTGLQFHSSWNLEPDRQVTFIKIMGDYLKTMPDDFLHSLKFIDVGGGYWPSQGEWLSSEDPLLHYRLPANDIKSFADQLTQTLKENILNITDCTICLEPGRWICNDAMHILISVIDKKADDLVITDAGTNAIGWERFETDYFPVINLTNFENSERHCNILGSLCTPHDVWGYTFFGKTICEGDILMIPTQGAYTYSLRQQFIKPIPKVVVFNKKDRSSSSIIFE